VTLAGRFSFPYLYRPQGERLSSVVGVPGVHERRVPEGRPVHPPVDAEDPAEAIDKLIDDLEVEVAQKGRR